MSEPPSNEIEIMTSETNLFGSLAVVDVPDRCGNAPRKAVVRDFAIALASRRASAVTELLTADIQWTVNRSKVLVGADQVREWIGAEPEARELKIYTVITHGTECGVDGELVYIDGTTASFSHVMRFTGGAITAKIKELRSYVV